MKDIQEALNKSGRVVIPYRGKPYSVPPLHVRSNTELILAPGVVLEAERGGFLGVHDSLLRCENVENVAITGYGAKLRMHRADYWSGDYEKSEWRHALAVQGASGVVVQGLTTDQAGGDGLYIGPTWDEARKTCTDVMVMDCNFNKNQRQGISLVSGVDVQIDNCRTTGSAGAAPQAGIDIEPAGPADKLIDILVRSCVAEGNAGSGIMANLSRLSAESEPVSVKVQNCLVKDSVQPGLRALMNKDLGAKGLIEFVDCTVQGTQYAGLTVVWPESSPMALRFERIRWADVALHDGQEPFDLTMIAAETVGTPIEFADCVLYDNGTDVADVDVDGAMTVVGSAADLFRVTEPDGG